MKAPRLKIGTDCDGSVSYPAEFRGLDFIDRADLLQDWIYDLTQEYNNTLDAWLEPVPPKKRQ